MGDVRPHGSSFPCLGRDGTTGDGHRIHLFPPPSHPLRFYYLFDRWMGRQDPPLLSSFHDRCIPHPLFPSPGTFPLGSPPIRGSHPGGSFPFLRPLRTRVRSRSDPTVSVRSIPTTQDSEPCVQGTIGGRGIPPWKVEKKEAHSASKTCACGWKGGSKRMVTIRRGRILAPWTTTRPSSWHERRAGTTERAYCARVRMHRQGRTRGRGSGGPWLRSHGT